MPKRKGNKSKPKGKASPKKATMAHPRAQVAVKPKQQPKYGVLGQALGTVAKTLDKKYTGGLGHEIFKALTGSGDYHADSKDLPYVVEANTVVHPKLIPTMPKISNSGGMVRVQHREFITNITIDAKGSSVGRVDIQVGNPLAFPWLSSLGNRFQQYKVLGGVFEYVTLSGNAVSAAVPALGQISMVLQYDVARQPMTDQREILNTYYSNSGIISSDLMVALECETTEQPCQVYLVRNAEAGEPVPTDLRWYDFARLEFTIVGAPPSILAPNYVAGQLWFTYDLLLIKPVMHLTQSFIPPMLSDTGTEEAKRDAPIAKPTDDLVLPPGSSAGAPIAPGMFSWVKR